VGKPFDGDLAVTGPVVDPGCGVIDWGIGSNGQAPGQGQKEPGAPSEPVEAAA
jgi:hypothetical protein